ncbi:amidohydrolase [Hyphomonas sp.]|uniref:amidohydrolase n=1 Tax=Hyphomonas sp. TaxID=87 RepID=UPI00391CE1F0
MRLTLIAAAAAILAACAQGPQPRAVEAAPDAAPIAPKLRIFTGGTIYTGLEDPSTVSAVIVDESGRIIGTAPPLSQDWSEDEAEIIDLAGAVMFPGFTDAHAHLLGIGQREMTLNLDGVRSVAELVAITEAELQGKPPGYVLEGRGWIETGWPEGRMPTAADLDAVSPANPVIYIRADGHALVANSAALTAAGITDATGNPPGGKFERDANGRATGILIDTAMGALAALRSRPDEFAITEAYETGARLYASRGWTGIHNMSAVPEHAMLMQQLSRQGRLPQRVYNAFDASGMEIAASRRFQTPLITNRAVKLYMDGALGSRGALLIEPYADRPETSGLALMEPGELEAVMAEAEAANVQLAIHAIGDLANRRILDAYAADPRGRDLRWRIEHTQLLHPDDIDRVAASGLIPSMQPSHAIGDLHFAPARVGIARLRGAYAWSSLIGAGAIIAGGSDAPVEVGSPLIEFYAAVARRDLSGFSGEGWHPEEALTRQQALKLFTLWPAHAAFQEDILSTIQAGKVADFTVFDRDLMTIPEAEILEARAVMTVIGGEIVWKAD